MSVFGIGPAGENLVKFAGIVGDKGHAAAHNGVRRCHGFQENSKPLRRPGPRQLLSV